MAELNPINDGVDIAVSFERGADRGDYKNFFCLEDVTLNEEQVLLRYDSCTEALNYYGIKRYISQGEEVFDSIVDFAVIYAIDGGENVDEVQNNVQYTLLQASLLLTISLAEFFSGRRWRR